MAVPYNYKAIEKKWHDHIEEMMKKSSLPLVRKRDEIIHIHERRMKKKLQFPQDLYWDYGCDAVEMYELFAEPEENDAMWDDGGMDGIYRFITRFWRLILDDPVQKSDTAAVRNQLIYEVQKRMEKKRPDTIISVFMKFVKKYQEYGMNQEDRRTLLILLAPFAPYTAEALWHLLEMEGDVLEQSWPVADEQILGEAKMEIPVQVNGRVQGKVWILANTSEEEALAMGRELIKERLNGTIEKEIYIPNRIISFHIL